jgi:hypothetical protein
MATEVTFDDTFVLAQLTGPAVGGRAVSPPTRDPRLVDLCIERCVRLLRKHHGLTGKDIPSRAFLTEQGVLVHGLAILGHILGLHEAFKMVERTIEADWVAHTELVKVKQRYRDHITHPMRVTAIGWWFLHRSGATLLRRLAEYYRRVTETYRQSQNIVCDGHGWEGIVEFAWLATGLLHDYAFPLQYRLQSGLHLRKGLQDTLGLLPKVPACFQGSGAVQRRLAPLAGSWLEAQSLGLEHRIAGLCRSDFSDAHALLGGLHHCLALRRGRLHSLQGLVMQLACRAIITHHDEKGRAIRSDPLALLLVVCDRLQSWERPFLHREAPDANGTRRIRPLIECFKVTLHKEKTGFVAVQHMNHAERKTLRKEPYRWCFKKFSKPNAKLENHLRKQNWLPPITCSGHRCIDPRSFPW